MTTPYFCEASHIRSDDGCYEEFGHDGQHRGWETTDEGWRPFYWDSIDTQTDLSTPEPAETFTDEELAILITALQPVKHFFPGLEAKLVRAREALK